MSCYTSGEREGEAGFALVAVLWFMVLVSAVVASFAVAARTNLLISSNAHHRLRLDLMAENIALALSQQLLENDTSRLLALPLDSTGVACEVGDYSIEIRAQDQAGLIDLNVADQQLVALGLRVVGLPVDESSDVATAIAAFRSYFTETDIVAPIAGGMKGGPFESVAELSDIEPLYQFELGELQRVFTVLSRQPYVLLSRSPGRLATELTGDGRQLVRRQDGVGAVAALSLEVTVREGGRKIRGYAGYLIAQPDQQSRAARRVEPLFEPAFDAGDPHQVIACPTSLQTELMLFGAGT